ncbi:MAG TPA: RNA methyltransferase [Bacteroidota bacterium]|nr:RNA methyltransferase [Bacteroidota bacterium]
MSLAQKTIKEIRALSQKKARDEQGLFVVEGLRLAQEAAGSDFEVLRVLHTAEFVSEGPGRTVIEKFSKKCRHVEQVTAKDIDRVADTVSTQGVIALLRQKQMHVDALMASEHASSVLVALDGVSDPGNLGSIVRTCDWFAVSGIFIGRSSVDLYNPKVIRATMGGIFHLPVVTDVDLLSSISRSRERGYTVYVADGAGETHFDRVRFAHRSLIVLGNEAWGVSDQIRRLADMRVAIRRYGSAESLNVGVACGVILAGLHRLPE